MRNVRRGSYRESESRRPVPRSTRSRRAAPSDGGRPARCERRKLDRAIRSGDLVLLAEQFLDECAEGDKAQDDDFLERQQQRTELREQAELGADAGRDQGSEAV